MSMDKINTAAYGEKDNLVSFLSDLVRIKSITCSEDAVVRRVREEMERIGFDEIIEDTFGNIAAKIGNGPKVLLFDAHLDVVDTEGQVWDTDPFEPVMKNGRIYGRGTVDDKGPFASALYAGKLIKELDLAENLTVYVVGSTVEEECEGLALGAFIEEIDISPDFVVIAESSNLEICRGHKGRAQITATFKGRSVHASVHHSGVNPVDVALPFLESVVHVDKNIPEDDELGRGHITIVDTKCESLSLSSLPTSMTVVMDRRTTTLDTYDSLLEELKKLPAGDKCSLEYAVWSGTSYKGREISGEEFFPGWILEENHPLVQAGVRAYADLFNEQPVVTTWGFSTNGNYTMGKRGFPTVGFGPGNTALCHLENEYIVIDDLVKAAAFYAALADVSGLLP